MKNWRGGKKNRKDAQTHRRTSTKGFRGLDKALKRTEGGFGSPFTQVKTFTGVTALTDSLAFRCSREGRGTNGWHSSRGFVRFCKTRNGKNKDPYAHPSQNSPMSKINHKVCKIHISKV
ncbi:hypothetical protein PO909_007050 [Leuciscus waleckii]